MYLNSVTTAVSPQNTGFSGGILYLMHMCKENEFKECMLDIKMEEKSTQESS